MAIFTALSTARSGLTASGVALSVIGNNIANVNTVGFKGSRAEFADLLSVQGGAGGAGRIGLGTRVGRISPAFTQGSIEATGRLTDLAIDGAGLFIVHSDDGGNLYTRAGNFRLDADGRLVTFNGLPVQGFELSDQGQPIGPPQDIILNGAANQPRATELVTLKANLQSDAPLITGGFDGTTFDTAFATSNFTSSLTVFDSLGARHNLTLFFTHDAAANSWTYNVGVDAGEVGGTAGDLSILATGALTFNTNGSLATAPDPAEVAVTFNNADAQTITLNFGTPNPDTVANPTGGFDGVTQFAAASAVGFLSQDGLAAGQLLTVQFSDTGIVTAVFDNGQTKPLFQLALANFPAVESLTPIGDNLLRESIESGSPAVGVAGSGGLGSIDAGSVELSNVSLAEEFIDLIATQRAFQANARVITTGDTLLADLINIVR